MGRDDFFQRGRIREMQMLLLLLLLLVIQPPAKASPSPQALCSVDLWIGIGGRTSKTEP